MKPLFSLLCLFILSSCSNQPDVDLKNLNGYWEIEEVIQPDGSSHIYKINETVDYFELNDSLKGYRQKMKTSSDNTYKPVTTKEQINIVTENDSLKIKYQTPFSEWTEHILLLNKDQLQVLNKHEITYIYKRYIPLNL